MYPRLIKSAAVLAAVSLCAAAASLYWVYRSGHAHLIGSLVFAETVRPESKIKGNCHPQPRIYGNSGK